jgi:hypothetical protein
MFYYGTRGHCRVGVEDCGDPFLGLARSASKRTSISKSKISAQSIGEVASIQTAHLMVDSDTLWSYAVLP